MAAGSHRGLRASDADRESIADRLRIAAGEGRLDPFELDERLSQAYAAKYWGELDDLVVDVTPPPTAAPAPPPAPPPAFVRRTPSTNPLAIVSVVGGLIWMWWLGSILAVICGHVALHQIRRSGGRQAGRGLAIGGLALGYLGLAALLFVFIGVAVGDSSSGPVIIDN